MSTLFHVLDCAVLVATLQWHCETSSAISARACRAIARMVRSDPSTRSRLLQAGAEAGEQHREAMLLLQ